MRGVTAAMMLSLLCWMTWRDTNSAGRRGPAGRDHATINALVQFMAQLPADSHATMFAAPGVTIVENYAPFIFSGPMPWQPGRRDSGSMPAPTS